MPNENEQMILLSEESDVDDVQLGGDGAPILRTEDVFTDAGECDKGGVWGKVDIVETDKQDGVSVLVSATLFEKQVDSDTLISDTLLVKGIAKRKQHNNKPSFEGRLAVIGGTGKYRGRRGEADVKNCNPKRWIIDLTP